MGFRKKTKFALKMLFFGGVNTWIEGRLSKARRKRDELDDEIGRLEEFKSIALDSFGLAMNDDVRPGRPRPDSDEASDAAPN